MKAFFLFITAPKCALVTVCFNLALLISPSLLFGQCVPFTPQVTLSRSADICQGETVILSVSAYSSYTWSTGATSNSIEVGTTGSYTVTVEDHEGCIGTSSPTIVTERPNPTVILSPSGTIQLCTGESHLISATGASSYGWSNSQIQNSITVNTSGTYSVVGTSQFGCASPEVIVTVNDYTFQVNAGTNSPICAGNILIVNATSYPGATYTWSGPNGFAQTGPYVTLTNTVNSFSGKYYVTATNPVCQNPAIDSVLVQVNGPLGTSLATSNTPVCVGNSILLTATTVSGATCTWVGPNGFSSTSLTPTISNASLLEQGMYTATFSVAGCSNNIIRNIYVKINSPTINASVTSPICQNQAVYFNVQAQTGSTFLWTGPLSYSTTIQNPSLSNCSITRSGDYTVAVTTPGCGVNTTTVSLTVGRNFSGFTLGSNSPLCINGTLNISAFNSTIYTYSWVGPNGFTSDQSSFSRSPMDITMAGIYTVTVSSPGCGSIVRTLNFTMLNPSLSTSVNTPVCAGNSVYLQSVGPALNSEVLWQGPNGYSAQMINPTISQIPQSAQGVYTCFYTSACGVFSSTVSLVVGNSLSNIQLSSNGPVCAGNTLRLSAMPALSGSSTIQWDGPGGFTSGSNVGVLTGTQLSDHGQYSFTASTPGCGTVVRFIGININSPSVTASVGTPVCQGEPSYFQVAAIPGSAYVWTGPAGFNSVVQNPSLNNTQLVNSGVYSVTVTIPGCNPISRTMSLSVSQRPVLTPGSNTPVCQGNVLNLSHNSIVGATFTWTGPAGFLSNLQSPSRASVLPTHAGNYTITVVSPGCGTYIMTIPIVIGGSVSGVSTSSNSPVCVGNAIQLSCSTVAGATYNWTGPNGFNSNLNFPIKNNASLADNGTYSVLVTSPGCGSVTRTIAVSVRALPIPAPGSNTPVCQGNVLFLTSASYSGATYFWEGPAGYTSAVQNPSVAGAQTTANGTYTVYVTVPGCVAIPGTNSVIIGGSASGATVGSNTPVCSGSALNITSSTIFNGSYLWAGPAGYTSSSQNPVRNPVLISATGVYTLTLNAPGCTPVVRNASVVVSNAPTVLPGSNTPVCAGNVLNLTHSTVSGATYLWSGPSSYTSSSQNPSRASATVAFSGIYTLSISTPGCGNTTQTHTVLVSPPVGSTSITSNSPVCENGTLQLSATSYAGVSYNWTGPNGYTASGQPASRALMTTANAGTYSLTIISPGCLSFSEDRNVTVVQTSTVTASVITPVCVGAAVFFTGTGPGGTTYLWAGPNAYTSNLQNPSLTNVQLNRSGIYTMTATVTGCGAIVRTTTLQVNSCRIANPDSEEVKEIIQNNTVINSVFEISPNPFSDNLIWKWNDTESGKIKISDIQGRLLMQTVMSPQSDGIITTSDLPAGVYLLTIDNGRFVGHRRIIKQ